jgi:hypothetical protein
MKHWDLIPSEIVRLRRGLVDHAEDQGKSDIHARFLFHTTRLACFEIVVLDPKAPPKFVEYEALDDGSLREVRGESFIRRCWHVVGPDRNTRTVVRQLLGQHRHYTVGTEKGLAHTAKGASA